MELFFSQVFTLLTTPPGNLVYRAILAFSTFGALQMSARQWQDSHNRPARRMAMGLTVLLLLQLGLFVVSGLGWQNLLDAHKVLPVLEWGVTLLSIVWILWLWAFPERGRGADAALGLLSILIVTLSVFGVVWWSEQDPALYFNGSWADQAASGAGIVLSLIGMLILLAGRPALWGYGLASMALLFAGCLVHWLLPSTQSDYSGIVRLAEMVVFPLLLALPQRLVTVIHEPVQEQVSAEESKKPALRHKETDPKLLQAVLALAGEPDLGKLYQGICRLYSQLMVADLCLVALPPDESEQIVLPGGYDLITDHLIDGFAINARRAPLLTNVLRRGRNLRLQSNSSAVDLSALAQALGVKKAGHLLAVAVSPKGGSPLIGIILLSPYSDRSWSAQDQQYLTDISMPLAGILQRARLVAEQGQELEQIRARSGEAQALADQSRQERENSAAHLAQMQTQYEQERMRATSLADLVNGLESKVTELEAKAFAASGDKSKAELQEELHLALTELSELKAELASSDQTQARTLEIVPGKNGGSGQAEVLSTIAQELRRPVSSIIGYTDLLLGESVGLLGAMQRKFLERVKASTERMGGLLDELINATTLENGGKDLHPTAVDLNAVIDEALAAIIGNISERNIALRVDLPDDIPQLRADRDALLQILTNLLQNAGMVTPVDGEIWLRTRVEIKENEPGYVLLQVTDSGGGIPPEALPRVFSRLYRSDNQTLPGVGDNGVGLAIVKTLVEAHGGRIWVDSEMGRGATYSVLLPLADDTLRATGGAQE
jgi:signal transduction histidine kinase